MPALAASGVSCQTQAACARRRGGRVFWQEGRRGPAEAPRHVPMPDTGDRLRQPALRKAWRWLFGGISTNSFRSEGIKQVRGDRTYTRLVPPKAGESAPACGSETPHSYQCPPPRPAAAAPHALPQPAAPQTRLSSYAAAFFPTEKARGGLTALGERSRYRRRLRSRPRGVPAPRRA